MIYHFLSGCAISHQPQPLADGAPPHIQRYYTVLQNLFPQSATQHRNTPVELQYLIVKRPKLNELLFSTFWYTFFEKYAQLYCPSH